MTTSKLPVEEGITFTKTARQQLARFILSIRRELGLALRTNVGRIGLALVLLHVVVVLFGPWIAPYTPTGFHLKHQLVPPSSDFLLGTDEYGRDILSRILWGASDCHENL